MLILIDINALQCLNEKIQQIEQASVKFCLSSISLLQVQQSCCKVGEQHHLVAIQEIRKSYEQKTKTIYIYIFNFGAIFINFALKSQIICYLATRKG